MGEMASQQSGADQQGARRWVGDVQVAGQPLGRVLDALCYSVTGIVFAIMASQDAEIRWAALLGLGAFAYGAYIYVSEGSYWVTWWVYIIGLGGIVAALSLIVG